MSLAGGCSLFARRYWSPGGMVGRAHATGLGKKFCQPGLCLVRMQLFFAEAGNGAGGDGDLLLVGVVGDQHAGDGAQLGVGFNLLNDVEAVTVVDVELAVDEDEVEGLFLKCGESAGGVIDLDDVGVEG